MAVVHHSASKFFFASGTGLATRKTLLGLEEVETTIITKDDIFPIYPPAVSES